MGGALFWMYLASCVVASILPFVLTRLPVYGTEAGDLIVRAFAVIPACAGLAVLYLGMRRIPVRFYPGCDMGARFLFGAFAAASALMIFGILIGEAVDWLGALIVDADGFARASFVVLESFDLDFASSPVKAIEGAVLLVVVTPVLEELVFRKALLGRIWNIGEKRAIVYSALVFALAHVDLSKFFYTFGTGLVLAFVFLRTKRIGYSIAIHIWLNFMGMFILPGIASLVNEILASVLGVTATRIGTGEFVLAGLGLLGLLALLVCGCVAVVAVLRRTRDWFAPEGLSPAQIRTAMYVNGGFIGYAALTAIEAVLAVKYGILLG